MRWLAPLLAAAALSACGDEALEMAAGAYECVVDTACLPGQVCEEGVCVADRPNALTVSLQVRPPATSGLRQQQFQGIALREGRLLPDLLLARPVTLSGRVRMPVQDNPLVNSVPGRVVLRRQDAISGTTVRFETAAEDGKGYELSVVPGRYDLSVFPDNEAIPPFQETGFEVRQDTIRDVYLPDWSDYGRLTGRVVVREGDEQGVPGIRVRAFSADVSQLSTVDITDADGRFEVVVPPVDDVWTLRLQPSDLSPLYPTVDVPDLLLTEDGEVGDLALGAGTEAAAAVCARVLGAGDALPGTLVEFSADVGEGRFVTTFTTDAAPEPLRVTLLAGSYTVRLVPPIDSDFAVTHRSGLDVEPVEEGCEDLGDLAAERKRSFEGLLVQPGNEPAADVTVEAVLTGNGDVKGLHRRVAATTHDDGRFLLRVDPGYHDLTFIPPDHSGLPRWTERGVEIRSDTSGAETVRLKDPDLITGLVRAPDNKTLSDATVEVYDVSGEPADATLIGLGTTDPTGRYTIVLPNP